MNNRIKELRKTLNESQDSFSSKLNLSRNFVWMIEKGEREASDRTIKDICRIFNVNETWLRSGEGEMFQPMDRKQEIAKISTDLYKKKMMDAESEHIMMKLIEAITEMNEDQLEAFAEAIKLIAEKLDE